MTKPGLGYKLFVLFMLLLLILPGLLRLFSR